MNVRPTTLPDVLLLEPRVSEDDRGYFFEQYNDQSYRRHGIEAGFVQDNISKSVRGVIRGLHFQNPHGQGKLVTVLHGAVFDVAVDVRAGSPTFGRWVGEELSSDNRRQLYIPPGFAHGFAVISDTAVCSYKCTDYYSASDDLTVLWNDSAIGISWPVTNPILSPKDQAGLSLSSIPRQRLPIYRNAAVS
jgi:dTDP-4-dehydrorhamnose 3,5-epimerase